MTRNMLLIINSELYYLEDLGIEFARKLAACHNGTLPNNLYEKLKHKKMVLDCPKTILASLIVRCSCDMG